MAAYVEQLDLQVQGLLTQENLGPVLNLLNSVEKITKVDKKWIIRGKSCFSINFHCFVWKLIIQVVLKPP